MSPWKPGARFFTHADYEAVQEAAAAIEFLVRQRPVDSRRVAALARELHEMTVLVIGGAALPRPRGRGRPRKS